MHNAQLKAKGMSEFAAGGIQPR